MGMWITNLDSWLWLFAQKQQQQHWQIRPWDPIKWFSEHKKTPLLCRYVEALCILSKSDYGVLRFCKILKKFAKYIGR